jgi:hypothetical protein
MNRDGHQNNKFFTGIEVEKTKFYKEKTLFVIDLQDTDEILNLANEYKVTHIYLGANMSYKPHNAWKLIIDAIINEYNVTLDIPFEQLEITRALLGNDILLNSKFALMVSAKIPKIESVPCIYLKVDDIDFNYSNPGVWVHSISHLKDAISFTPWSDYKDDNVL